MRADRRVRVAHVDCPRKREQEDPMSIRIAVMLGLVLVAGACAREPEPEPVAVAPTVDKLGNATCPSGLVLATQAGTGSQVCVDPATL